MEAKRPGESGELVELVSVDKKCSIHVPVGCCYVSPVLSMMLTSPCREGRERRVVFGSMDGRTVERVGWFLQGKLSHSDLFSCAFDLLFAGDFLQLQGLTELAEAAVAEQLGSIHSFGLLPRCIVKRVLNRASPIGLIHAESISSDTMTAEEMHSWLRCVWSRLGCPKTAAVETWLEQKMACFSPLDDVERALLQGFERYGTCMESLRIKNKLLCKDVQLLEKLLEFASQIKVLDFSGSQLGGAVTMKLCKFLENCPSSGEMQEMKEKKTGLELGLNNTGLTENNIRQLASIFQQSSSHRAMNRQTLVKSLRELNFGYNQLGDVGFQAVVDLIMVQGVHVRKLNLSENMGLGPESLHPLCVVIATSQQQSLETLNISNTNCDVNRVLEALFGRSQKPSRAFRRARLKGGLLSRRNVQNKPREDGEEEVVEEEEEGRGGGGSLMRTPSPPPKVGLVNLDVSFNYSAISPMVIAHVMSCDRVRFLEEVNLSGNKWDDASLGHFCDGAASLTSLKKLWMANTSLSNEGAKILALGLLKCTSLEQFDISRNSLACKGTAAFAVLLSKHPRLQILDVSGNDFDVLVGGAFGAALAKNPSTITRLTLQGIGKDRQRLRTQGCAALCRGLLAITRVPLNLTALDLTGQGVTCRGCSLLSNVIGRESIAGLRQLVLRGNHIKDKGAQELVEAVVTKQNKYPTTCFHLNLTENELSPSGKVLLEQMARVECLRLLLSEMS